ncbi:unnamed protein product [Callosobruchus maculatus]|uniref:Uncharacterized protein n=1 Tax=Callosobruchus maculatus TaxID=64391 RepID=A0A653BYE7_CALMS|nr:unnamed protein product [Callosobruchus maculatus]
MTHFLRVFVHPRRFFLSPVLVQWLFVRFFLSPGPFSHFNSFLELPSLGS